MAMDATLQIRMNSDLKAEVEELYRNLGTSFAEAVRIFAQQSLREGGMPFPSHPQSLGGYDGPGGRCQAAPKRGRHCGGPGIQSGRA